MAENKRPVEDFDHALQLLDHELEHVRLNEPLQIRAIGGYALLKHGVREDARALTADIDTMTRDYSAAVERAIQTVAAKTGLDPDWINNDNLGDSNPEDIEATYDAKWLPQENGLKNIDLAIADVPTLTRAKIIAADTAEFSGRTQDGPDLARLVKHQGIGTMAQFQSKYPDPFQEYPAAQKVVADALSSKVKIQRSAQTESKADRIRRELRASVADLDWGDDEPGSQYH